MNEFLNSSILSNNFSIEKDNTKLHYPVNVDDPGYRADHFIVKLSKDHPKFKKFKGLRCELQIQTLLNHAYSETTHDIL